jgi:hypothetical protein
MQPVACRLITQWSNHDSNLVSPKYKSRAAFLSLVNKFKNVHAKVIDTEQLKILTAFMRVPFTRRFICRITPLDKWFQQDIKSSIITSSIPINKQPSSDYVLCKKNPNTHSRGIKQFSHNSLLQMNFSYRLPFPIYNITNAETIRCTQHNSNTLFCHSRITIHAPYHSW